MSFLKRNRLFASRGEADTASVGTPDTGVTAVTHTEGRDYVTVLTFSNLRIDAFTAGAKAIGTRIYRFPAGVHVHTVTYMSLTLSPNSPLGESGTTGDLGIGSVLANGAVAVLGGTAGFEDYITGQSYAFSGGSQPTVDYISVATAGALTDISLNRTSSSKSVYINVAATWAEGGDLFVSGTVVLKWTKLA